MNLEGRVLVLGGKDGTTYHDTVEELTEIEHTEDTWKWTTLGTGLMEGRAAFSATVVPRSLVCTP